MCHKALGFVPNIRAQRSKWFTYLRRFQKWGLEYVLKHGKIGNKEYRQITGLGKVFTAKELNELVKKKIFIKVGKGSATRYVLSERSVND